PPFERETALADLTGPVEAHRRALTAAGATALQAVVAPHAAPEVVAHLVPPAGRPRGRGDPGRARRAVPAGRGRRLRAAGSPAHRQAAPARAAGQRRAAGALGPVRARVAPRGRRGRGLRAGVLVFRAVLVANRGEIARRVFRACRRLGVGSVAVFSEAARAAPPGRAAGGAVLRGPAPARESSLDVERILDAARRTGADAVHPGYGLLSEHWRFAEARAGAGPTF